MTEALYAPTGRRWHTTTEDRVLSVCWCERHTFWIPRAWVRAGMTADCGGPDCWGTSPVTGPRRGMRPLTAAHGTRSRYIGGCRCNPCTEAERLYSRAYKRRRAQAQKADTG